MEINYFGLFIFDYLFLKISYHFPSLHETSATEVMVIRKPAILEEELKIFLRFPKISSVMEVAHAGCMEWKYIK